MAEIPKPYDYVAKPLDPARCHSSIQPNGSVLVFQCNMPRGYGTRGLFCKQHAAKDETHANA